MARIQLSDSRVAIWVSANETYNWAHRPGASWPCSTLSNKRFFAEFDDNGLCELTVNGREDHNVDAHEFNALCADMLAPKLPETHPLHFVCVGQFL